MAGADRTRDPKLEELAEAIRQIRDRVRERHPDGSQPSELSPADLTPLVHARDAAQTKVASIGTVNPRRGGPLNALVQGAKRLIARALDWHVREQVEFNRATMAFCQATLDALDETNAALARAGTTLAELRSLTRGSVEEMGDIRGHWEQWRQGWEQKLATNEMQFLRSVADLQTAFQHRATLMEGNFRDLVRSQHDEFTVALDKATLEIQRRLWADLERIRGEYEALIHNELRLVRLRAMAAPLPGSAAPVTATPTTPAPGAAPPIDWLQFGERFRGSQEYVRAGQEFYRGHFAGCRRVLDLGCGRGEFLDLMKEAGIAARGVDLSEECVALCRARGLEVERADLFEYLDGLADGSLDGIFCAQVVEHLPPERIPGLIGLAHAKLERGGLLAIETPNPECLAIFATHFYLDPTHTRPLPPQLMLFYMEEAGFGRIEVHRRSPAVESMPALATLPEGFRDAFFGALDYAVLGRRLS